LAVADLGYSRLTACSQLSVGLTWMLLMLQH